MSRLGDGLYIFSGAFYCRRNLVAARTERFIWVDIFFPSRPSPPPRRSRHCRCCPPPPPPSQHCRGSPKDSSELTYFSLPWPGCNRCCWWQQYNSVEENLWQLFTIYHSHIMAKSETIHSGYCFKRFYNLSQASRLCKIITIVTIQGIWFDLKMVAVSTKLQISRMGGDDDAISENPIF